ncbi:DUF1127 domain-containing protein [Marinobacterium sp. YM272]|uniref:DUF1127 domain-containing protein n=1 Tax=Marinobacterium sp. YM272 TaxID=3421654 RepID=UPI003D7FBB29
MNTQVQAFNLQCREESRPARTIKLADLFSRLKEWHARARQRRQLATLPPEMLKDIGVSRTDALKEANKPFWRC